MKIDRKRLSMIAANARRAAEDTLRRQKEVEQITAERKQKAVELEAEGIINYIDIKCEKAALKGDLYCDIMELKDDHIKVQSFMRPGARSIYDEDVQSEHLTNAAKIVWDECVKAGLKPQISFWHDGMGMKSGNKIRVNF